MFYEEDLSPDKNIKIIESNTYIGIKTNMCETSETSENSDSADCTESDINTYLKSINYQNIQKLNYKLGELNKKINFVSNHEIKVEPVVNFTIENIIGDLDQIINQINMAVIANGQISPKPDKTIMKKIIKYEFEKNF